MGKKKLRVRLFEKGQSTLEMIAIAPMLFGFIYMVYSYGVPIYMKLGLQNISYSFAMNFTRVPVAMGVNSNLYSDVESNVTNTIPGFASDDFMVYQSGSSEDVSFLTDLAFSGYGLIVC